MPMRGELPTIVARSCPPPSTAVAIWAHVRYFITNPELQSIVAFCSIGLLVMINVMARFPDLGGFFESSALFP